MKQTLKEFAIGAITGGAFTLLACTVASAQTVTAPETLMVNVPNVGPSRLESVNYCLRERNVSRYQDLITDDDFVTFERCLRDLT